METNSQPEGPEWFCGASALQNGGHSLSQRPLESRRFHAQSGPGRDLSFCSSQGQPLPVSEILVAGKDLSIQHPAFRSVDSSQSFHQNIEACSGLPPYQRTEDRIVAYLYDFLIIGSTKGIAEEDFKHTRLLLESLGFTVNLEKS